MAGWNALFDQARAAFAQHRSFERARTFGVSALTCLGRRTLSGLLCASGQQFRDWSAAYRLFERERLDREALWRVPPRQVAETRSASGADLGVHYGTRLVKRGHPHLRASLLRRPPPLRPRAAAARSAGSMPCPTRTSKTTVAAAAAATASLSPLPTNGVARKPSRGPPCTPWPPETSTTSTPNSSPRCAGRMPVAS